MPASRTPSHEMRNRLFDPALLALILLAPAPFAAQEGTGFDDLFTGLTLRIDLHHSGSRAEESFTPDSLSNLLTTTCDTRVTGNKTPSAPVASGIYFCTIDAGDFRQIRKMVLLR